MVELVESSPARRNSAASLPNRVTKLLLGTEPKLRARLSSILLSFGVYAACAAALWCSVSLGLTKAILAAAHTPFLLAGPGIFYIAVRSGWSRRFADPALTVWQMQYAVLMLCLAYAINPATRQSILELLVFVMAFGTFRMQPRQARQLAAFTLACHALTMAAMVMVSPAIYRPRIEFMSYALLTCVVLATAALSTQVAELRSRWHEQRDALKQAVATLEQMSRHDALTGLVNRRHMIERLEQECARLPNEPTPSCVCMLDLDHFKRINDQYGHAGGDETLRRFARLSLVCLRETDSFARWGGEEFLLLMPGTDESAAGRALERLRAELAQPSAWQECPTLSVTFSAGVAQWRPGESVDQVLERADRLSYRAKSEGRNRWVSESTAAIEER